MLKVYTSNIVTSQRVYKRYSFSKKIKKAYPSFCDLIDILTAILFLPFLFLVINHYFTELQNVEYFNVKNIELKGLRLLGEESSLNLLNIDRKANIFKILPDDITSKLHASNLIEKIKVTKKYPNSIIIDVTEKKPFLQLAHQGRFYIYDKSFSLLLVQDTPLIDYFPYEVFSSDSFNKLFSDKDSREELRMFFATIEKNDFIRNNNILKTDNSRNLFLISKNKNLIIELGNLDFCKNFTKFLKFVDKNGLENLDNVIIDTKFKDMIIVKKI